MIAAAVCFHSGELLVWVSEMSRIFVCSFCKCHLSKASCVFFFGTYAVMKASLKILLTWSKMLCGLQIARSNRQDGVFFQF